MCFRGGSSGRFRVVGKNKVWSEYEQETVLKVVVDGQGWYW